MVINSSRIKSVNYNESTEVLTIDFTKGGKYKYFQVPQIIYEGIVKDNSNLKELELNFSRWGCENYSNYKLYTDNTLRAISNELKKL